MSKWIKVDDPRTGAVLKIDSDELTTTEFFELVLDLYEKVTYCNPVSVKIKGGIDGKVVLKSKGCY